ncbi:AAA family ATPase [bacterium]|nr:AAA family ATPase [bacterium]
MAVYSRPPDTSADIVSAVAPKVFNPTEIAGWLRKELDINDKQPPWIPTNGILICGTAAAGKSTLARELASSEHLHYMQHIPTEEVFNKEYTVRLTPESARSDAKAYGVFLEEYAFSRLWQAVKFLKQLSNEREKHKLSEGSIVIGGLLQSLVTLCAYTKTFVVDQQSGQFMLPEPLLDVLVQSMQKWAPRVAVFVDAPLEERISRAKKQAESNPVEWEKRVLPFRHDAILKELTISTLRSLFAAAKQKNMPFSVCQYNGDIEKLQKQIYHVQNHDAQLDYRQRLANIFG